MRLSTCSTEISLSIRPSSFSSRSVTDVVSRIACRSGILRARCEATVSALVFDLLDDADHLGRHPLVELRVALEVIGDRAREGLGFDALTHRVAQRDRLGLVILAAIRVLDHFGALSALDQDLDGAIGELEQLQHARKRANVVDRLRCRIVVGHVLLGGEQDEGVGPHHLLEREDRLLASDEEGRDHVRKYDGVAQRQHRIGSGLTWRKRWAWLCSGHARESVLLSLNFIRSRNLGHYRPKCGPKQDQNLNSLSRRFRSPCLPRARLAWPGSASSAARRPWPRS